MLTTKGQNMGILWSDEIIQLYLNDDNGYSSLNPSWLVLKMFDIIFILS